MLLLHIIESNASTKLSFFQKIFVPIITVQPFKNCTFVYKLENILEMNRNFFPQNPTAIYSLHTLFGIEILAVFRTCK